MDSDTVKTVQLAPPISIYTGTSQPEDLDTTENFPEIGLPGSVKFEGGGEIWLPPSPPPIVGEMKSHPPQVREESRSRIEMEHGPTEIAISESQNFLSDVFSRLRKWCATLLSWSRVRRES